MAVRSHYYLFVFLAVLVVCAESGFWDSVAYPVQYLGNKFKNCPRHNNIQDRLQDIKKQVFGQDKAIDKINAAINGHNKKAPLVFLLAGDNGVGKTLTASLIADAIYSSETDGLKNGVLYLRGNNYVVDSEGLLELSNPVKFYEKIDEMRQEIRASIINQLEICADSLIIFDEYTIPNVKILSVIEEFLDGTPIRSKNMRSVQTKQAIFIFLTDFGAEDFSHTRSKEELEEIVRQDIRRIWENDSYKQDGLMTHVIPFVPLGVPNNPDDVTLEDITLAPKSIVSMVGHKLQNYANAASYETWANSKSLLGIHIGCGDLCVEKLSRIIYYKQISSPSYRFRNYRGIENLFFDLVEEPIFSQLASAPARTFVNVLITPNTATASIDTKLTFSKNKPTSEL